MLCLLVFGRDRELHPLCAPIELHHAGSGFEAGWSPIQNICVVEKSPDKLEGELADYVRILELQTT